MSRINLVLDQRQRIAQRGVRQNFGDLGRPAFDLLLDQIAGTTAMPAGHVIEPSLVVRDSALQFRR